MNGSKMDKLRQFCIQGAKVISPVISPVPRINQFRKSFSVSAMNMANDMSTFPSRNTQGDVHGLLTGDLTSKKGLIVLHEWWGKNEQIKQQGAHIGQEGKLMVLVPDLYRGKLAKDAETAGHYMKDLDWQGAVMDIEACVKFLQSKGCFKVGVTGFCMGGALSLASAALLPDHVSAAAPFYGIPPAKLADVTKIKCPVQAHFASEDHAVGFSSKQDYDLLRNKLESAGVPLEFHEYKAAHAFCNPENRIGPNYNEDLAKLAMRRLCEFMQKNL